MKSDIDQRPVISPKEALAMPLSTRIILYANVNDTPLRNDLRHDVSETRSQRCHVQRQDKGTQRLSVLVT